MATDDDGLKDMKVVTVTVTNVDEDGTVELSTLQPRVGIPLTAELTDIDGATTDIVWKWEGVTGEDCSLANFPADDTDDLEGGESGTYMPKGGTDGDVGKCLRATATYTDPQGPGKTAMSDLADAGQSVEIDDTNKAPMFPTRTWRPRETRLTRKGASLRTRRRRITSGLWSRPRTPTTTR